MLLLTARFWSDDSTSLILFFVRIMSPYRKATNNATTKNIFIMTFIVIFIAANILSVKSIKLRGSSPNRSSFSFCNWTSRKLARLLIASCGLGMAPLAFLVRASSFIIFNPFSAATRRSPSRAPLSIAFTSSECSLSLMLCWCNFSTSSNCSSFSGEVMEAMNEFAECVNSA